MAWRENQAFESMALHDFAGPGLNIGGGDRPEQVKGIHVSAGFFSVFGARPALGRSFTRMKIDPLDRALRWSATSFGRLATAAIRRLSAECST